MRTGPLQVLAALRRRLDGSLFREAPAGARARLGTAELTLAAALIVLAALLQMIRVGWSQSLDSLWAEDGTVFLQAALDQGFGGSIFDTYATYLVVVPRAIGEVAGLAPIDAAAAAMSISSALVVALSGLVVWFATGGLLESPYLRAALCALTVLSPVGGLESTASAAYVPWYMLFASFWILLWRPASTVASVLAGAFLLLTGLSTPGLLFFLPLALLRSVAARDHRDGAILGGYWIGALAQLLVLAFNDEEAVAPRWTDEIWTAYAQRVVDGAVLGLRLGGEAWRHLGWPFLALLLATSLAALAWGLARSNLAARLLALIAIPTSGLMFAASAYQRAVGSDLAWDAGGYAEAAGRYAIVPSLLLVSVAFVIIDRRNRRSPAERCPPWLQCAAAAAALCVVATSFYVRSTEARGEPPWSHELDAAAARCAGGGIEAAPVATSPPGWGLSVPCDELDPPSPTPGS